VSPESDIAYLYISGKVSGRLDFSAWTEILQTSIVRIKKSKMVKSHMHLPVQRETSGTQETWIVQKGRGIATFFDLDGTKLIEVKLSRGSVALLLRGGHSLKALSSNFTIVEVKNGPYQGEEFDRVPI
jgi:hypothetical protein